MAPGSTIRTLILKGETSATSASERPFSANLEAEWMLVQGWRAQNSALEMLTMVPDLRSRMEGMMACFVLMGPKKSVVIWLWTSSRLA